MSSRRLLPLAAAALIASTLLLVGAPTPAAADAGPAPASMAALGDSITRAFNGCGWYSDCASRSWSTGTDTAVNSHYLRIRSRNGAINGRNYNLARTGARSDALASQAQAAVTQRAAYVTILLGANDACTSSEAAMTPVGTFRARIDVGLATLKSGVPDAKIYIVSIPDIKRLWFVGKDSSAARAAWSLFGICKAMLERPTSTAAADIARRDRVRQRVVDYNAQYAAACVSYGANCRFDGNAAFNYPFALNQLSTWDYFHPNTAGQRTLADLSYQAGYGW
jgi:lysophospholipase L1-like esterase